MTHSAFALLFQGADEWRRRFEEEMKELHETHRTRLQAEKEALRKDHVEAMHLALQVGVPGNGALGGRPGTPKNEVFFSPY